MPLTIVASRNEVLGVQGHYGIEDIGAPRWQLVLSLAAVFFIVYFSIWKGIKSSGKVRFFIQCHKLGGSCFVSLVVNWVLFRGFIFSGWGYGLRVVKIPF